VREPSASPTTNACRRFTPTPRTCVHIAINKVHPTTRRNIEPYYDKQRLMEACDALEIRYGLQRTDHGVERQQAASNEKEQSHEQSPTVTQDSTPVILPMFPAYVSPTLQQLPESKRPKPSTVCEICPVDMAHRPTTDVLLPGDASKNVDDGRANRDEGVRRPGHGRSGTTSQDGLTEHAGQRARGRAGDMEAHDGRESLLGWIKREAIGAFNATDWQSLHAGLAKHGLSIKPRGAGFVVGTRDGVRAVKPSEIRRDLAAASLTRRLGAYEAPAAAVDSIKATKQYRAGPKHGHAQTGALFAEFQRSQIAAQQARDGLRRKLREDHQRYAKELADYHRRKRERSSDRG
jgi:hypothetical protein